MNQLIFLKNHLRQIIPVISLFKNFKSLYGTLKTKYLYRNHIIIKGNIKVLGIPIFLFKENGLLILNDNVVLRSESIGYHTHMHSPVKIVADRRNAIIEIGKNTRINGSCIHAYKKIKIGKNCLIAANTMIMDGSGHDLSFENVESRIKTNGNAKEISIEDNVWIGANCIILPGVTIGYGSVIGAGSVVNSDIPPMCIALGNPVKVVKTYSK